MVRRTTTIDVQGAQAGEAVRQYGSRLVRAILIVDETASSSREPRSREALEALFAEMDADAAHGEGVSDDSRAAIYTRLESE